MKINQIKLLSIAIFGLSVFGLLAFQTNKTTLVLADGDIAADYKKNCAACHTATASKFYDPAKPEAQHIEIILKGKKGEKPPYMPAFEAKGVTAEQAKAYAEYMRKLRTPDANSNMNTATNMAKANANSANCPPNTNK